MNEHWGKWEHTGKTGRRTAEGSCLTLLLPVVLGLEMIRDTRGIRWIVIQPRRKGGEIVGVLSWWGDAAECWKYWRVKGDC